MMAEKSLETSKRRLTERYLGKAGIHGIGARQSQKAIYVYVTAPESSEQKKVIKKIEKEAAPFRVVTVREERPRITSPGRS